MSKIVEVVRRGRSSTRGATPPSRSRSSCSSGATGRAAVPSGASTGAHEAVELRDGGDRYGGKGVRTAVEHVNGEIADAVVGLEALDQRLLDDELCRARRHATTRAGSAPTPSSACRSRSPRPRPTSASSRSTATSAAPTRTCCPCRCMNVLNGGAHADSNVDLQEFMLAPVGAASFARGAALGRGDVPRAARRCCTTAGSPPRSATKAASRRTSRRTRRRSRCCSPRSRPRATRRATRSRSRSTSRPPSSSPTAATCSRRGHGRTRPREWADCLAELCDRYPIVSIEDGMAEDDWDGWAALTERARRPRPARRRRPVRHQRRAAAAGHRARRRELDPRQGQPDRHAVRDARHDAARRAAHGYTSMMSHRSGETEDATIADLAVATNCGQIKTGAPARSDRVAKYNQLLRIEERARPGGGLPRRRRARQRRGVRTGRRLDGCGGTGGRVCGCRAGHTGSTAGGPVA